MSELKSQANNSIHQINTDHELPETSFNDNVKMLRRKQQFQTQIFVGKISIYFLTTVLLIIFIISFGYNVWSYYKEIYTLKNKSVNVLFAGFGTQSSIEKSLESFMKFNDYNIDSFIGIVEQIPSSKITNKYSEILWVIVSQKEKFKYIDRMIETPNNPKYQYLFYFDTNWQFTQPGFIQQSVRLLMKFPRAQQILLADQHLVDNKLIYWETIGFSFSPGLHRRADIVDIRGGFTGSIGEENINDSQEKVERRISSYFLNKYMYAFETKKNYAKQISNKNKI